MGKSGSWFSAVKKGIRCESKEKKRETSSCGSGRCFWKQRSVDLDDDSSNGGVATADSGGVEDVKLVEAENEQNRHAYSVALVTAMAAEAAVAAAHAAAEVVRLRAAACKSKEEIAAIKIQTAFRTHLAKRTLRALKGQARLKSLICGHSVKRQAATASKCLQTMGRVQSEVRAWRIRISDATDAVHREIHRKHVKKLEKSHVSNEQKWNDSMQSKEHIESKHQNRQAAATRRERALAYAYSHQQMWRSPLSPSFTDPSNPGWAWNWLERWMATQSWENRGTGADREPNIDLVSAWSWTTCHSVNSPPARKRTQPRSGQSPLTPKAKGAITLQHLISPRGRTISISMDNDSKSINSAQSGQCWKHSIAGSSARDDDSLTVSSPAVSDPPYMASTESARAKSRSPSSLKKERCRTCDGRASTKKRLSFSCSPDSSHRRQSIPAKTAVEALNQ